MVNNETTLAYRFLECILVTAVGELDIRPSILEFNYFEDIFSNGFTGSILLNDSVCIHNLLSLSGDEFIRFTISKPGNPTPLTLTARVYTMKERILTNDDNENEILYFCADEYFLSEEIKVSKAYKDKYIHEIVEDIAYEFLKISAPLYIEPTLGKLHLIIPNLKPLQAINWLCTMAISKNLPEPKESGASYLFWQNRDGFWFNSLLDIFNRTQKYSPGGTSLYNGYGGDGSGYWYGVKNVDPSYWNKYMFSGDAKLGKMDPAEQIISYHNLDSYNSIEDVNKGKFANSLLAIDYIGRTRETHKFDYAKYFAYLQGNIDLYKTWNIFPLQSNARDRFGKMKNEHPECVTKVHPTNKVNNVEIYLPHRFAQLSLLGSNRYKIQIPGDPNISVGKMIYVHMPQTAKDETHTKKKDRFLSGRYLVTTVRHKLDQENDFVTVLELMKDSFTKVNEYNGLIPW